MTPLLQVRSLSVSFVTDTHRINAVRDVSFDVAPGEKLGFVGESGSGKTTTALALMGLVPNPGRVTNGAAWMGERDLLGLSLEKIKAERLRTISYIPQGAMNSLNPVQRIRTPCSTEWKTTACTWPAVSAVPLSAASSKRWACRATPVLDSRTSCPGA